METEELFKKKLQSFKEWWNESMGVEPSEKLVWYFEKGMETHVEMVKKGELNIAGDMYFRKVILLDDEHYPDRTEYEDCQRAFRLGIYTDMSTTNV